MKLFNVKKLAAATLEANNKAFMTLSRRPKMFILLTKHKYCFAEVLYYNLRQVLELY